ncbi:MAG: DMT family transporter [Acidobacteriota bacterium]
MSTGKAISSAYSPLLRWLAIVLAWVLWGATFFFGKIALSELTVLQLTLGRFGIAAAVLVPIAVWSGELPRRRDWWLFALAAFLGIPVTFVLQYGGLALTTSTDAALIVGGFPLVMAIGAAWFRGERLSRIGWLAVSLSTVGVGLVVGSPQAGWLGRLLVLLSLFSAVAWVLLTRKLLDRYSSVATLSPAVVASMLALGIGCTAATFTLWNWGLERVETSRAGVFVNLEPVVGAALGVTLLGDSLATSSVVGGALVLACAVVICLPLSSGRSGAEHRSESEREVPTPMCSLAPSSADV